MVDSLLLLRLCLSASSVKLRQRSDDFIFHASVFRKLCDQLFILALYSHACLEFVFKFCKLPFHSLVFFLILLIEMLQARDLLDKLGYIVILDFDRFPKIFYESAHGNFEVFILAAIGT